MSKALSQHIESLIYNRLEYISEYMKKEEYLLIWHISKHAVDYNRGVNEKKKIFDKIKNKLIMRISKCRILQIYADQYKHYWTSKKDEKQNTMIQIIVQILKIASNLSTVQKRF